MLRDLQIVLLCPLGRNGFTKTPWVRSCTSLIPCMCEYSGLVVSVDGPKTFVQPYRLCKMTVLSLASLEQKPLDVLCQMLFSE